MRLRLIFVFVSLHFASVILAQDLNINTYDIINGDTIINSKNYKDAILKTIKAGGCNCSRANFVGAYFASLKGINSIPKSWIKKTIPAKKILNQK